MLIVKVAFLATVLFLVVSSLASEEKHHSRFWRVLRSSDDHASSMKERETSDWYFEQCSLVNTWKEHIGYVSVLAFLDPAWYYSFRQAIMLKLLSLRLWQSGFPDIRFFMITPFAAPSEDGNAEDDLEIEAWLKIGAKYEMEIMDDQFLRDNRSEITFLRDNPQSRIWERFQASRDQIVVIDRCGKLTYQIIVPWSILYFPYVKAAILSTYQEDPCNGCDPTVYRTPSPKNYTERLRNNTDEERLSAQGEIDGENANSMWTITHMENSAIYHNKSSTKEHEANNMLSISLEGTTDNIDHLSLSNATETSTEFTIYQYDNGTTESWFDENRPHVEETRRQENLTSSDSNDTDGIITSFEPQRDVFLPEQMESHLQTLTNNNSVVNHKDTTDRILLLDEPAADEIENDSTSVDEQTTFDLANKIRDGKATSKNGHVEKNTLVPLRIIMYAPHVHKNGRKIKKYKHLVLKTDDPNFHEHLESRIDVTPSTNSCQILIDDADSRLANSEEYNWRTTEANADIENLNSIHFDKDESPGLYGEVTYYWKSYEDNDITDRNKAYNKTKNNSMTSYNEKHYTVNDYATNHTKSQEESYSNVAENPNVKNSTDSQNVIDSSTINSSKPIDTDKIDKIDREEKERNKMEIYSKLLFWIHYKLN